VVVVVEVEVDEEVEVEVEVDVEVEVEVDVGVVVGGGVEVVAVVVSSVVVSVVVVSWANVVGASGNPSVRISLIVVRASVLFYKSVLIFIKKFKRVQFNLQVSTLEIEAMGIIYGHIHEKCAACNVSTSYLSVISGAAAALLAIMISVCVVSIQLAIWWFLVML
jgi:hypothetical protein